MNRPTEFYKKKIKNKQHAFSLIEILVAVTLLSSLVLIVSPLLNAMRENRSSEKTMSATNLAEQTFAKLNDAWRDSTNYDSACIPNLSLPTGVTLSVNDENLDGSAGPAVALTTSATCPAPASNPALLRKAKITVVQTGASNTVIETKVVRPQ